MRFSSCIHCPFICSSKPPRRLYPPGRLKFKDVQQVSSSPSSVSLVLEEELFDPRVEAEKCGADDGKVEISPKSILKKPGGLGSKRVAKGRVKWVDFSGKELVEIREFEPIESGESDDGADGNQSCGCLII